MWNHLPGKARPEVLQHHGRLKLSLSPQHHAGDSLVTEQFLCKTGNFPMVRHQRSDRAGSRAQESQRIPDHSGPSPSRAILEHISRVSQTKESRLITHRARKPPQKGEDASASLQGEHLADREQDLTLQCESLISK